MNDHEKGRVQGERLKREALQLLQARRGRIVRRAQRAMLRALLAGAKSITADALRGEVELPEGVDPKCLGAVPSTLAKAGIIRAVGYVKSCRPVAHARPLTVWELADLEAAEQWLRDNPPPPDDMPTPDDDDDLPLFRHVH